MFCVGQMGIQYDFGARRAEALRAWEPVKDDQHDIVMWSRLITDPSP